MPRESKSAAFMPSVSAEDKEEIVFLRQKFSSLVMRGHYKECFKLVEDNLRMLYFKERWPENFYTCLQYHKRCYASQGIETAYDEYLANLLKKNGIPPVFVSLLKGSVTSIDWSAEFFRDLAMVSESQGDLESALGWADLMVKQDPLNSNSFLIRGWILQHMELDDEAVEMLQHALELNRNNYQASSALAEVLLKTDPHKALKNIDAAIEQNPGEAGFYASRAKIYRKLGQLQEALEAWEDAIARDPLKPEYSYEKGELLLADNQTIAAVRQFGKAVGVDPAHTPSLDRLSHLLADTQPETALSYANTVVTQQPENLEANLQKARLLERTGQSQASIRSYRQALELDGSCVEANASLGRLFLPDAPQRALGYFEKAAELEPRSASHVMGKAQAQQRLENLEEAVKSYRTALSLDKSLDRAWAALGDIYRSTGDQKQALECFTKAAQCCPDNAYYHLSKGELLLAAGKDGGSALECFLAAERTDPGNAELQVRIGQLLEAAGNDTSALDRYRKAVNINPELAAGYFGLARLMRTTEPDMALLHINSAIDLDANQGDYYYMKYRILLELGHKRDALSQLMRTLTEKNATPETLQEASLLLGEDSLRVALLYINRAIEMLPDNAEYLCARAQLLASMGESGKALGQFLKAAQMDPTLHAAEFGAGRILAGRSKARQEALEHLDRALALAPDQPDYHAERARLLAKDPACYEQALEGFDRAIALDTRRWEDVLHKARLLEEHADIPSAVEHYRRTLLIKGDTLEANARLGVLLADRNPAAALVYLERAAELDPDNYLYHVWRGRILYARGDHGAAEGEYMAALELGGETAEVLYTLALVLYEKLPENGLKYCHMAMDKEPDNAGYRLLCGKIHLLLGETKHAEDAFAQALERDPKCHEALAETARLQFRRGETVCLETVDRALAIQPGDAACLYDKACMLQELRQDLPGAIECLRAALKITPAALAYRELLVELLGKNNNPIKRLFEKRKLDRERRRQAQAEQVLLQDAAPPPPAEPEAESPPPAANP